MAQWAAQLAGCITSHAWNGNCTQLAVCPNNAEVHIYKASPDSDPATWERLHVLKEHDQVVSALDWAPSSNMLLSASHDRNIYVWTAQKDTDTWSPALVVHQLNRAAVCARWSPSEAKFAVGSGAKAICVCYYEEDNNWWVGKIIKKKHDSTVLAVAWHPNNLLVATASSDFKCRVFAAQVKGVDDSTTSKSILGSAKFGDELLIVDVGSGWAHSVCWAPSGSALAFASHAGAVHFVSGLDPKNAESWLSKAPVVTSVKLPGLPLVDTAFLSEGLLVGVGFDCSPLLFVKEGGGWMCKGELAGEVASGAKKQSAFSERLATFKSQTDRGESGPSDNTGAPKGVHQNTVTSVRLLHGRPFRFSTSGIDGKVALWAADEALAAGMSAVSLSAK